MYRNFLIKSFGVTYVLRNKKGRISPPFCFYDDDSKGRGEQDLKPDPLVAFFPCYES